jgi:hypothetical protein
MQVDAADLLDEALDRFKLLKPQKERVLHTVLAWFPGASSHKRGGPRLEPAQSAGRRRISRVRVHAGHAVNPSLARAVSAAAQGWSYGVAISDERPFGQRPDRD